MVIIVTVPLVLETWLKGQPKFLSKYYDVEVITSDASSLERVKNHEQVNIHIVDFTRKVNLLKDMKVLLNLIFFLLKSRPEIVYTLTPKAGLLGMIAAWVTCVPCRVHCVVGLPHLAAQKKKELILRATERVTYWFASNLYCNSLNLKTEMEGKLTKKPVKVIGHGSVNGVDTSFFYNRMTLREIAMVRKELGIHEEDFVITFVGRIVKDKGVNELIEAFRMLKYPNVKLLLLGDFEDELDPIKPENKAEIRDNLNITHLGFIQDIRKVLSITSLFVLPSYREGLPNVLIEAGSFGVPLLATNINGCNEVIADGVNGALVKSRDAYGLYKAMDKFISNQNYYNKIKENVRDSIITKYGQKEFLKLLVEEFSEAGKSNK